MSGKKLVNVRVLEAEKKRWDAEAKRQGVSLSEFVRSSVGARIGAEFEWEVRDHAKVEKETPSPREASPSEPETGLSMVPAPAPPGSAGRSRPCVHRVPVTEKCRFGCDG